MSIVAVIGAGPLGANVAHLVAQRDVARQVYLLDSSADVAAGKALDIMQSAPIDGFAATVSGSADLSLVVEASIVVLADDARGGTWEGDAGLAQLTRLRRVADGRPIICADGPHRTLVERGVRELGFARECLFGSAPEALASALRAMVALDVNGSPRDISLTCLGVPPAEIVVPWEDTAIAGLSAVRVLDETARRRIQSMMRGLWPPGPIALASAAAECVVALLGGSRRHLTTFVAPDDRLGRKARAAMWPVALAQSGIARVHLPTLTAHDRTALDNATAL